MALAVEPTHPPLFYLLVQHGSANWTRIRFKYVQRIYREGDKLHIDLHGGVSVETSDFGGDSIDVAAAKLVDAWGDYVQWEENRYK